MVKVWNGPKYYNVSEAEVREILENTFPKATIIQVTDVSRCGMMFDIFVEAYEFKGLSILKQHRQVYTALNKQIKLLHGLRLKTQISP